MSVAILLNFAILLAPIHYLFKGCRCKGEDSHSNFSKVSNGTDTGFHRVLLRPSGDKMYIDSLHCQKIFRGLVRFHRRIQDNNLNRLGTKVL